MFAPNQIVTGLQHRGVAVSGSLYRNAGYRPSDKRKMYAGISGERVACAGSEVPGEVPQRSGTAEKVAQSGAGPPRKHSRAHFPSPPKEIV